MIFRRKRSADGAAACGWEASGPAESVFDRSWLVFRLYGPAGGSFRNVILNPRPGPTSALGAATFQGQSGADADLLEVVVAPLIRPIAMPLVFLTSGNARWADHALARLTRTRFVDTGDEALDRRWRILGDDADAAAATLDADPALRAFMAGIEPQRWMAYAGNWETLLPEALHRRTAGKLMVDLEPGRLIVGVDASTGATWRRDGLIEFAERLSTALR